MLLSDPPGHHDPPPPPSSPAFLSARRSPCFHTHSRCLPWGSVQDKILRVWRSAATSATVCYGNRDAYNAVSPEKRHIEQTETSVLPASQAGSLILFPYLPYRSLRRRRLLRSSIPQRLIRCPSHPQSVQQHRQLPRHCRR